MQPGYRSKTDIVEATILEWIEAGDLPTGAVLEQREIAEQLGVSPTPVREAFRRLETAGVIITQSHASARVAEPIDANDPVTLRIRACLESIAMELAARNATPQAIARLRDLASRFDDATGDEAKVIHREFHFGIFELSRSTILMNHIRMLWNSIERKIRPRRPKAESAAQHHAMLDALESGDGDLAYKLLHRHLTVAEETS